MRILSSSGARPKRALPAALALALFTAVLAASGIAWAQPTPPPPPQYDIIDLGTLDTTGSGAIATGINNVGQVVGTYGLGMGAASSNRSFLYDIGTAQMIDLGVLSNRRNTNAWAINDWQQVVGQANNSPPPSVPPGLLFSGFLWDNGILTNLTPSGSVQSAANAINGAGQIAGRAHVQVSFFVVPHAAIFSGGSWTDLGALFGPAPVGPPAFNPSEATGINESGQVVGYFGGNVNPRSFLYTPGSPATWIELNPACPYTNCTVYPDDINDQGQVVGRLSYAAGTSWAFLYSNGQFQIIPTLGGASDWAFAINNSGQVVGQSYPRAFLYQNGTTYDLNNLIAPGSDWTLQLAHDINDAGLIVGGGQRTDQKGHAFLLMPKLVDAGGPYSVAEGASVTVTATGIGTEPLTYEWDLDNDGTYDAPGQSVSFDAASIDGPATRTIRVRAIRSDGLTSTSAATVNVLNVVPTADFAATRTTLYVGQSTTLAFSNPFDPSPADMAALTYVFDCTNDGNPDPPDAGNPMQAVCTYASAGTFAASGRVQDDDGAGNNYGVTITVLTPQQGIQGIIQQVNALVPGTLNQGQGNSLIAKLNGAISQLDKGNVDAAINQLQAFINEVSAMIQSGKLDQATGDGLIAAANDVIAALTP